MQIDCLIESEREKAVRLGHTASKKYIQQIQKYGFFTVSIEHEENAVINGISIVLHGPPMKQKRPPLFHNHDYYEMVYVYRGGCCLLYTSPRENTNSSGLLPELFVFYKKRERKFTYRFLRRSPSTAAASSSAVMPAAGRLSPVFGVLPLLVTPASPCTGAPNPV